MSQEPFSVDYNNGLQNPSESEDISQDLRELRELCKDGLRYRQQQRQNQNRGQPKRPQKSRGYQMNSKLNQRFKPKYKGKFIRICLEFKIRSTKLALRLNTG